MFTGLEGALGSSDCLAMPNDGLWAHPLLALVRPKMVVGQLKSGDRRPLHVQFTEMKHSLLLEDPSLLRNINTLADLE